MGGCRAQEPNRLEPEGAWNLCLVRWSIAGRKPAGRDCDLTVRRIVGLNHCIWELALYVAYWEYAVRRNLEGGPKGTFPRGPSNWLALPEDCSERVWTLDRQLVKRKREALIAAVASFSAAKLKQTRSGESSLTYEELLIDVIQYSAYHTGQIALLKRMVLS